MSTHHSSSKGTHTFSASSSHGTTLPGSHGALPERHASLPHSTSHGSLKEHTDFFPRSPSFHEAMEKVVEGSEVFMSLALQRPDLPFLRRPSESEGKPGK